MADKIVELLLPESEKFMMWSAATQTGVFNSSSKTSRRKRLTAVESVPSEWDSIWGLVDLPKAKRKLLGDLQTALIEAKPRLGTRVQEFLRSKQRLVEEAGQLGTHVERELMEIFPPEKLAQFLLWTYTVSIP